MNLKLFTLDEESSTLIVNELLTLKKGPDPALLELEDRARDALLEKVRSLRDRSECQLNFKF